MKHRQVLLIGALLAAVMSVPSAFADDTVSEAAGPEEVVSEAAEPESGTGELLKSLFGEGGPLNDALPEDADINAMVDAVKEQLDQADSEIGTALSQIYDMAQKEAGTFSPAALEEFADNLLSRFMGGGEDFDFSALEALFEINDSMRAAEEQYIKDRNAETMDPADVQIVSNSPIYTVEYEPEDTELTNMATMIQGNYRLNDENQLLFVSGAEDIVLFRHQKDEEGNYPVAEATFAEAGETYTASIEKMCEEVGITPDECFESIAAAEAGVAYDLAEYLENNPDITGIEYQGEIRTANELKDIFYDEIAALYPPEEEALTEDTDSLE